MKKLKELFNILSIDIDYNGQYCHVHYYNSLFKQYPYYALCYLLFMACSKPDNIFDIRKCNNKMADYAVQFFDTYCINCTSLPLNCINFNTISIFNISSSIITNYGILI